MAVTYATAADIDYKAGANVATVGATAHLNFGLMAESIVNTASGYDWSSWYTTSGTVYPYVSGILIDAASNLGAIYVINYDMSGFTNIQEAVARINTLYAMFQYDVALLKEEKQKDYVRRGGT